jgi:hypothetical protein
MPPGGGPPPYGGGGGWGPGGFNQPPKKSKGPMIAIIVVVAVVLLGVVGVGVWAIAGRGGSPDPKPTPTARASSASPSPTSESPSPSESTTPSATLPGGDAYSVQEGQCVKNEGTDSKPNLKIVDCAKGTYKVLKKFRGTHDTDKCKNVAGSDSSYYQKFGSDLSSLDFVLCLQKQD